MLSDRELLELAAKAAGYEYKPQSSAIVIGGIPATWNPLTDDGDALRLAVKLEFSLRIDVAATEVIYKVTQSAVSVFTQLNEGDKCDSTRRAIVRAAAEIGRQM